MPTLYQGARVHPLSEVLNKQAKEAVDEDYITPERVIQLQRRAIRQFEEDTKLQTPTDRETGYKISLLISELVNEAKLEFDEVEKEYDARHSEEWERSKELQKGKSPAEIEKLGIPISPPQELQEGTPYAILGAWNKLVNYIKTYQKVKNIGQRDMIEIWNRLTEEVLPNVSGIVDLNNDKEMYGYYTPFQVEQLLELEDRLQNKQLLAISNVSPVTRSIAERREREKKLAKIPKREGDPIEIPTGLKIPQDIVDILNNIPDAEQEEVERSLTKISQLPDKAEQERRLDELFDDINKRFRPLQKEVGNLRQFYSKIKDLRPKELTKLRDDIIDQLTREEDPEMQFKLNERLLDIEDLLGAKLGVSGTEIEDLPTDIWSEENLPPASFRRSLSQKAVEEQSLPPSFRPATTKKKRGRPRKEESGATETKEPEGTEGTEGKGKQRPRRMKYYSRKEKSTLPVIYDDKMDDYHYIVKKLNK